MVFTKLPQLSCKLLLCVLKQPNFSPSSYIHQHFEQRKMGRSVYFSFFPFLSARPPPHLTRLFPHPGIFSLSRQLLDHLLQSRNSNVENQEVINPKKNPTTKLPTWQSACPACPWWSAPTPTCSPSPGSSSRDA